MMRGMVEDGVDALMTRFAGHAAVVEVGARVEGSPLLECVADEVVLHVLDRTGPYLAERGPARVIIQAETAALERVELVEGALERHVEVVAVSAIIASGVVLLREDPFVVVDAGLPFVVTADELPDDLALGERVRFESRAPIHGFVLPPERRRSEIAPDEQV